MKKQKIITIIAVSLSIIASILFDYSNPLFKSNYISILIFTIAIILFFISFKRVKKP